MFIILILQIILFSAISFSLNVKRACLFKEEGVAFSLDVPPLIQFFIPHDWTNNEDTLNYLNIKLMATNLVLRHPSSSKKKSNEIDLPLNEMGIGWNKIFLKKQGNNVEVELVNGNSQKVIQNVPLRQDSDSNLDKPFLVTGLYSLVNCLKDRQKIYYNIRAKSKFRLPFILYKRANKFEAFSKKNSFKFKAICSGKTRKVCKNGKDSVDSFTIRKKCKDGSTSSFSRNILNEVYVPFEPFDSKDIVNYNYSAFIDLVLENKGNNDFYVEMIIIPPSNVPISLLKVDSLNALPPVKPTTSSTTTTTTTTTTTASPKVTAAIVPVTPIEKGCGMNSKNGISNRIFGGTTANEKDWPWMVAFVRNSDGFGVSGSHVCGGVLITERLVLTSASCFSGTTYDDVKARLGEYDFGTHEEGKHVDLEIEEIKIHEDYNRETNEHDIAMIKLRTSTGEAFPPACLPPSSMNWEDQFGYITGWGKQFFEGENSNQLREALVQIWKKTECEAAYSGAVTDNMLCAGSRDGKGSCEGDNGGPLVAQISSDARWYVIGIDSWGGFGCDDEGFPTVYTRVDKYLEWIKLNMNP